MLVQRVDKRRIVQKQQTALRQRGRHFVRRLGDQIGPEIFRPHRQRRTEVEVRCMRGINHDRNPSRVCPFNDAGDIPNDPEVVGRGKEHTIDALATDKLVESAQRGAGREPEFDVVFRYEIDRFEAAMDQRRRDRAVSVPVYDHPSSHRARTQERQNVQDGRAIRRGKAPVGTIRIGQSPLEAMERLVAIAIEQTSQNVGGRVIELKRSLKEIGGLMEHASHRRRYQREAWSGSSGPRGVLGSGRRSLVRRTRGAPWSAEEC